MSFDPYNCALKIQKSIWDSNSHNGTSLGSVRVHSLTLFALPWTCDVTPKPPSWPTTLQALSLIVSPRLGLREEGRARVCGLNINIYFNKNSLPFLGYFFVIFLCVCVFFYVWEEKDDNNVPLFFHVVLLEQRRRWQQATVSFFFMSKKRKKKRMVWQCAVVFFYGGVLMKKVMVTCCHRLLLWWC